jgi:hypothetical protein
MLAGGRKLTVRIICSQQASANALPLPAKIYKNPRKGY